MVKPDSGAPLVHFSQLEVVLPILHYFETLGVDTRDYLAAAGLNDTLLEQTENPVPVRLFFKAMNALCRDYDIEDPGLLVGKTTSIHMLGNFGRQLLLTRNLRDYFRTGFQLINASASGDQYWLVEDSEQVQFCMAVSGVCQRDKVQSYLYTLLVTINTVRMVAGQGWCPSQITVPGLSPETASQVAAYLPQSRVFANGDYAHFTLPAELMLRPMPELREPGRQYRPPGQPVPTPVDCIDSVRKLIRTLILTGKVDIAVAAVAAGLSRRTLQRRLEEGNTTFSVLVAETRIALAQQWIAEDRSRPLADIAASLGYHNPANFTRAFRRVTGMTPSCFQRQLEAA